MKFGCLSTVLAGALLAGWLGPAPMAAQRPQRSPLPASLEEAPAPAARVVEPVDESRLATLRGNTHPMARAAFERGRVPASQPMERMMLVLKRSPEQQAALERFNQRQYDPASEDFHHWLSPEQFGSVFGPSDSDVATVTNWLQNHGFRIDSVARGRVSIQFSGTASQVEQAFHVELHRYLVDGEMHMANDRDPQVPSALLPVVHGVASLHDFFPKPQHQLGRHVTFDRSSGHWFVPDPAADPASSNHVLFTHSDSSGNVREDLVPYDFATIYNLLPLWNAAKPINGSGVTIAIAGLSDIYAADYNAFRANFGLPAKNLQVIYNGQSPGVVTTGGQQENTLDVEWSGGAAPGAQVVLVVSATGASYGGILSMEYAIDNQIAPILSASYGQCELGAGLSGNTLYNALWQQAASEGISGFVSSGDQGSAGCTSQDGTPPYADTYGLQVNGMASSPWVTAVGGTDLNWQWWQTDGFKTYWNSANSKYYQSAKGYIPEVPWNSTCASSLLLAHFVGSDTKSYADNEAFCNAAAKDSKWKALTSIQSGSGGVSHCTNSNQASSSSCTGGWAKPSWQVAPGVPADGKRDLPDISLFASAGIAYTPASAYIFCLDGSSSAFCNAWEVGGTSASAPAMAGIMALVIQNMQGAWQGVANPMLYKLAQQQTPSACATATVKNSSTCVFNDITSGNNRQVCMTSDPNCVTNTAGDTYGVLSGYDSTVGYDLVTGLGSVNATNLVNAWLKTAGLPTATLSPTALNFGTWTVNTASTGKVIAIANKGTGRLYFRSILITGTNASSFHRKATTCAGSLGVGQICTVTVDFKPTAKGALTAYVDVNDNGANPPHVVTLTGTGK